MVTAERPSSSAEPPAANRPVLRHFGPDLRHSLIVAATAADRVRCLRSAAGARYAILAPRSWGGLVEIIRSRPVELAVVDPLFTGEPRTHEIERLRVLFPSLPLLVYTALSPETAGIMLGLGRVGIRRAIFHRFDDAPAALREVLNAELEQGAAQQVLLSLGGVLQGLPRRIRWALEATLRTPDAVPSVAGLAERAQLKRRTCERWFSRSGLPSPKNVLMFARLLHAHRLLLDPGYTVEDVAVKLGYGKAKTMQMHFKEVFGLTAGEVRISLSAEEAVADVLRRYFAPPPRRRAAS